MFSQRKERRTTPLHSTSGALIEQTEEASRELESEINVSAPISTIQGGVELQQGVKQNADVIGVHIVLLGRMPNENPVAPKLPDCLVSDIAGQAHPLLAIGEPVHIQRELNDAAVMVGEQSERRLVDVASLSICLHGLRIDFCLGRLPGVEDATYLIVLGF